MSIQITFEVIMAIIRIINDKLLKKQTVNFGIFKVANLFQLNMRKKAN